jgi:hypothetical protein
VVTQRKRASADLGLMFVINNLRRLINIIGKNEFKEYLERLILTFFHIIDLHDSHTSKIRHLTFHSHYCTSKKSRLK